MAPKIMSVPIGSSRTPAICFSAAIGRPRQPDRCRTVLAAAGILASFAVVAFVRPVVAGEVSFNHDIRPLLAEYCFKCHGPDPDTREADLRLDLPEAATADRDGQAAIVPGKPEASLLLARVAAEDTALRMPPEETGLKLSAEQIQLLRDWIAAGAEYQPHWSLLPMQRGDLPPEKQTGWVRNPIDRFILARLEEEGLSPSPAADRYTLVRRVYLDFLGVLPSIDEADAFVEDRRPGAYERLLDRVLASPRFGERWGRHWLDQARYADSHGYTNDNQRTMWPYRDWVIDAFNRDLPFDRFTIEQLAGDLLPDPTLAQQVATGFHRNTLINTEGGTKADQFRDEQVKDRVDTTGGVWLGLTVGCAKCHSHKFDPISQTEYYELYAFFNSTADRNSTTPVIKAPTRQQQAALEQLDAERSGLQQRLAEDPSRAARQAAWEAALIERAEAAAEKAQSPEKDSMWTVLELDAKSEQGALFAKLDDNSILVSGVNEPQEQYQVRAWSPLTKVRSVRLEALTHPDLPKGGPGRAGNGNFVLSETWFRTGDGRELRFSKAFADHSQKDFDVAGAIDGKDNTGWAINGAPEGGANHNRTAWFVLPKPLEIEQGHALTFTLQFNNGQSAYNLGRLRLSICSEEYVDTPSETLLAKIARIEPDQRSEAQQKRLAEAFLRSDPKCSAVFARLETLTKEREKLLAAVPTTMVMQELDKPRQTTMQVRGDFLRPGEEVTCDVPAVLPAMEATGQPRTRMELARWLVRDDHPLTARVRINRIWMRLFGRGMVETENDFGTQGTLPTHPELLDWLALEFPRRDWSTKQMLRLIADSATYRQSSAFRSELDRVDPRNQLLGRQSRVRVEAEIVRDIGLTAAGLLSTKIGGPSVYPPQPEGVYAFTQRKKKWRVSSGEDRYRRGMYTFFYRSAPYPMLTTFDAPKFNQTCTRRPRSNTPLQSLTVANSDAMFEMTQALAHRVLRRVVGDDRQRLETMFRICFTRSPQAAEAAALLAYFAGQRSHFAEQPKDARAVAGGDLPKSIAAEDAAAWVATARVLINLDEFITRE